MDKLNIAPTKSNLLQMKEQLAVSTNGYELLEEKREILVRELMQLVERVKSLEEDIKKLTQEAYPAFTRMLMLDGADQIERLSKSIHYKFEMEEKTEVICGMQFSSIDVKLPENLKSVDETNMKEIIDGIEKVIENGKLHELFAYAEKVL